jgi:hypothetical protein
MTSGAVTLDTASVLAGARQARLEEDAAAVRVLVAAVEWARLHEVDDPELAARWPGTPVLIGGEGTPMVAAFAVAELAAALGVSTGAGRSLLAEALELAHRMPRSWARVQDGRVAPWRARKVAGQTTHLTPEAVAYVDRAVAPFVGRMGTAAVQRVLESAMNRFMPAEAEERRRAAADGRHVSVNLDQVTFDGTSAIWGELDLADAIDLDRALVAGAEQLAHLGSTDSLDVRRSLALGELSRGQALLDLDTTATPPVLGPSPARRTRDLTLFVHLEADGAAILERPGPTLLTVEQVRLWCGSPDARVSVRPVIDLAAEITSPGYVPSDRLREQVVQRDRTCVFPWCESSARRADLDHIEPYDPDGPAGQTTTSNLACLCRRHHRLEDLPPVELHPARAGRLPLALTARVLLPPRPHGDARRHAAIAR